MGAMTVEMISLLSNGPDGAVATPLRLVVLERKELDQLVEHGFVGTTTAAIESVGVMLASPGVDIAEYIQRVLGVLTGSEGPDVFRFNGDAE